jgi:putative Holliday junction resolvase
MTQNHIGNAPPSGRLLGLDVGERRIGVAISDPDRSFALPLHSIDRRQVSDAIAALAELVAQEEVGEIVVGLPLSLSGDAGPQAETTREFAAQLEARLNLPVHLWDERLSTQEAMRRVGGESRERGRHSRREVRRGPAADTDAIAASIILQAYLDHERLAAGGTA